MRRIIETRSQPRHYGCVVRCTSKLLQAWLPDHASAERRDMTVNRCIVPSPHIQHHSTTWADDWASTARVTRTQTVSVPAKRTCTCRESMVRTVRWHGTCIAAARIEVQYSTYFEYCWRISGSRSRQQTAVHNEGRPCWTTHIVGGACG